MYNILFVYGIYMHSYVFLGVYLSMCVFYICGRVTTVCAKVSKGARTGAQAHWNDILYRRCKRKRAGFIMTHIDPCVRACLRARERLFLQNR